MLLTVDATIPLLGLLRLRERAERELAQALQVRAASLATLPDGAIDREQIGAAYATGYLLVAEEPALSHVPGWEQADPVYDRNPDSSGLERLRHWLCIGVLNAIADQDERLAAFVLALAQPYPWHAISEALRPRRPE